ncbi:MAG: NTP transferase domain-containing protein [Candidatus Krumholzibacteriota bacterium]|nr:NTP transferase domain-containing protein [Candidatus Krumholzibacteriota bacterium]
MKAVIPVAGIGKRLRPHTLTAPKALVEVAGKPILGHIVDGLVGMGVTELVPIIGYMGDQIRAFLESTYDLPMHFVVQEEQRGIAHAVDLTRPWADDDELVIILGDTIIRTDFSRIPAAGDFVLGVREVEDPRRFGICLVEDGWITRIVEKPDEPVGNLAIVGLYYFRNSAPLYEACREIIDEGITTKGEFQITDALQRMIDAKNVRFRPYEIEGWFDCGKVETLLETNRILLDASSQPAERAGSIVVAPCRIDDEAIIEDSIVGPYVSVARGCEIRRSIVKDSILNEGCSVSEAVLEKSVIGAFAEVTGRGSSINIGDYSQLDRS